MLGPYSARNIFMSWISANPLQPLKFKRTCCDHPNISWQDQYKNLLHFCQALSCIDTAHHALAKHAYSHLKSSAPSSHHSDLPRTHEIKRRAQSLCRYLAYPAHCSDTWILIDLLRTLFPQQFHTPSEMFGTILSIIIAAKSRAPSRSQHWAAFAKFL
jgi:hypothetical protein